MKQFLLVVGLWFTATTAFADQAFEAMEHSCDSNAGKLRIHYQIFWNVQAPSNENFISIPGEYKRTCMIGSLKFETEIKLYESSPRGMCGGVPGGMIESLSVNGIGIVRGMSFNSCYSNWLDDISINVVKDNLEITYCGSQSLAGGEQAGCFVDRYPISKLPAQPYNGANFPYSRYRSKKVLEGTMSSLDAELLIAVTNGEVARVENLLAQGANPVVAGENPAPDGYDDSQFSALGIAATRRDRNPRLVKALLSKAVKSDAYQKQLNWSLFSAAASGDMEIAELLLKAGANPNSRVNNKSVLYMVIDPPIRSSNRKSSDYINMVQLLIKYGADPRSTGSIPGYTVIDAARKWKHDDIMNVLEAAK